MKHEKSTGERASFRREWNFAFALVAVVALLLLVTGYHLAGTLAVGLGLGAFAARWVATKRSGHGFYD